MGLPLSVFRGEQPAPGLWGETDRLLAQALRLYERDIHHCGQPLVFSSDPDARNRYVTRTIICHACETLDAAEAAERDSSAGKVYGQVRFVEPDEALRYGMEHPNEDQGGVIREEEEFFERHPLDQGDPLR